MAYTVVAFCGFCVYKVIMTVDATDFVFVETLPPPACVTPFVICACWHGAYYKIFPEQYETADCEAIRKRCKRIEENGWSHIRILRIPL